VGKQMLIKPMSKGGSCVVIKTPIESWHKGFLSPCKDGSGQCSPADTHPLTAGINVIDFGATAKSDCTVPCTASVAECRTFSVVYVTPSICVKVHVATPPV
jgi:hypothetical protein